MFDSKIPRIGPRPSVFRPPWPRGVAWFRLALLLALPVLLVGSQAGEARMDRGGPLGTRSETRDAPEPGPIRRLPGAPPWPEDFEIGLQAARAYGFHFGLVEEDSLLQRIQRIGYAVTSQVGRPDILFTFHILDVPDANALALPGGFIFLTRGMVDLHLPDAALANLLGHEATHVAAGHFSRAGRLNTALSLLQTAVVVAAILAVPAAPASGGIDRDPETGELRMSLAGRDAAIQGSQLFGGVFRELLLRGYSRNLEFEADDRGRRYAARAGYPSAGGVELLEQLHRRVYEDQEFGYWRTHPYFDDRVARARAAQRDAMVPPDSAEIAAYRRNVADRLAELAGSVLDEPTSLFLYRAALRAAPDGVSSDVLGHRLLQLRAERLRRQKPVLRAYGPLVADYDSLLRRWETGTAVEERAAAERERAALDSERQEMREEYARILDRGDAATPFLELFLVNFPEDSDAPAIRFRLAERYRLSDRPDDAALSLADLGAPEWRPRVREELRRVLPLTRELTTNQRILSSQPEDSIRAWASRRLLAQAATLDSLERGARFLQRYPDSPVSPQVRERMEELAHQRVLQARLRESLQDFQTALNEYNELLLLAPDTRAAALAREGIERIQTIAGR